MKEKVDNMTKENTELLVGAPDIAKALNLPLRRIYKLIADGELKVIKLGANVAIRKSRLSAWLDEMEARQAA